MQANGTLFSQLTSADTPVAARRAALAKAITLIESERAEDRHAARDLIERCLPLGGKALRLGITGIPGVGKSTLIDALGMHLIGAGHLVAVLAVDPSSTRSGGSILGDKTRMDRLGASEAAFIRPSPTRGDLGGVARRTRETIALCEAAGFDRIIVETVGVGQSELAVEGMTDLTVLLAIAGAGDELQGIKRGIMETADLVVLTKVDNDNGGHVANATNDLRNAIGLLPPRPSGRRPEVLATSATTGAGIIELIARIQAIHREDRESGYFHERRREQSVQWLQRAINDGLLRAFREDPKVAATLPELEAAVRAGDRSPFSAADELLRLFRTGGAPRP